ncbi:MAG: ATP-binding cassette domain-containing protein [Lachnospiraceae bacterium]|nr:ATP-binding cassette domain-containing protein [Lachnospiraceae bacterium]
MLYLNDLIKIYGRIRAVDRLSLHVPKGDLFGFVGPNGAGKTTTIRMLCGLLKPDYGNIFIAGYELRRQTEAVRRCIGYVPDFFGVYDNLKVREYMEFYGSIYGIDDMEIRRMTGDLLELVNLQGCEDAYVDTLSRGMKQRLCVARALLHNPELLVLDEPSSGLDPRARVEMKELLLNLHSLGKTVIISSHILSDISEMCTSIGIMNRGRLVAAGKMEDILGMGRNEHHLIITIRSNMEEAVERLKETPAIEIVSVREHEVVINCDGRDLEINRVVGQLMSAGVLVGGFRREESSLEALFINLTSNMVPQIPQGMNLMAGMPMGAVPGMNRMPGQMQGYPQQMNPMPGPMRGMNMAGMPMGQPPQTNAMAEMPMGQQPQMNAMAGMPMGQQPQMNAMAGMPMGQQPQTNVMSEMPAGQAQMNAMSEMPAGQVQMNAGPEVLQGNGMNMVQNPGISNVSGGGAI